MQKAVERPDDLADAEIGRLDAFYELIWQARMHELAVSRLGLGEADMSIIAPDLAWYLNSRLGRAWLDRNKSWLMEEPLLMEAVLAELESMPVPTQFQYLIDLRSIN